MTDPFVLAIILIAVLSLGGLTVGLAVMCGSFLYMILKGYDPSLATESMLQGLFNGYTLLAIPLFILAADIMNIGSLSERLMRFAQALVGRFRGGLGYVDIVASVIFSGMSGSAVADAVGMGRITINMMLKSGKYTASYAAAIVAATATIGPIIPPSIPMVLYALISDTSIGYLFAAGVVPGVLMAVAMAVVNYIQAVRRDYPIDDSVPLRELPKLTVQALPALMMPVILLGGIYGGVMSPTEAAAVAALYALAVSVFLYRSVSLSQFYSALLNSARSTAAVGVLVAGALTFDYVIAREHIAVSISGWINGMELGQVGFLIVVNLLLLGLGCILDAGAILLIVVPLLVPAAAALGVDLVHFGVIVVVNAMIGLITPPYGLLLFITANITKEPVSRIVMDIVPFLISLIVSLGLITFWPDMVLWLPRLLGYEG